MFLTILVKECKLNCKKQSFLSNKTKKKKKNQLGNNKKYLLI